MTYADMKAMPLLSSVHMIVEDLELIIQRVPHGWCFVYHKNIGTATTAIGTLFVAEKELKVGHYEGPEKHG